MSKVGRNTKYCQEKLDKAANIIRETGVDSLAFNAIGISKALFYRWKREHPEFKEAMEQAKRDYEECNYETAEYEIKQAKSYLIACLRGEQFQTVVVTKKKLDTTVEVETRRIQVLPPAWYLEKLYNGNQEKKELTVKVGIAEIPDSRELAIEASVEGYEDEQDEYEHFAGEDLEFASEPE